MNNVRAYSKQKGWGIENHAHFHLGDYQQVIPKLLGSINNRELGLFLSIILVTFRYLRPLTYVTRIRPRMEILIYLSAKIVIKRIHHLTGKSLLN